MLDVRDLSFSYGSRQVLSDIAFQLQAGELCALFGPNGSGKSTLFRCILGHLRHTGYVRLGGVDLTGLTPLARARLAAYVPQQQAQTFPFTALDMVLMGRTPHLGGVFGPRRRDLEAAERAIDQVGMTQEASREYQTLSGGQRQLVLIARALAQDARILLLDEPTASLDFGNQLMLWQMIRVLARRGATILVCTHEPNHVLWFCDRVLALGRDGRLIADGPASDLIDPGLVHDLYPSTGQVRMALGALVPDHTMPPLDDQPRAAR